MNLDSDTNETFCGSADFESPLGKRGGHNEMSGGCERNESHRANEPQNEPNGAVTPKRLFSANACFASSSGDSSSNLAAQQFHLVNPLSSSDCGSEYTRNSFDDISSNAVRSDKTEGSIKLNIPNLSTIRAKVNTSYHNIANFPWRLAAKTECTKRTSHKKYFSVYIDCNPESESTLWNCDAVVEFRLISHKDGVPDFSRQFTNKFNYNSNNWGFPSFMEWTEILNPDLGYIRGDRVVVEAKITVQKVIGVRRHPVFDFLSQTQVSSGILVIDGMRLHVSKEYLALHSPVFHAMFYSNFSERDKKEVTVEDVIFDEFIELLNVVYPSRKPVSTENVEFLLELGDKFEMHFVLDECERFLIGSGEISLVTKLVWADQYVLAKLQDSCIRTMKSLSDVKAIKNMEEYKNLSDTTKAALLEKVFKITKEEGKF
ncbi:unnamed protein product, partial [Mesorhabditis belari]|uniref:Uncharacterized protein n=1 Tax=Mesorhabditis belari TaxID=2138241 RepID=A0AAF3F3L5_9BILA